MTNHGRNFNIALCREDNIIEPALHKIILLSIALTRLDAALEYLIGVINEEHSGNAIAALEALGTFHASDDLHTRICKAVLSCDDAMVSEAWREQCRTRA